MHIRYRLDLDRLTKLCGFDVQPLPTIHTRLQGFLETGNVTIVRRQRSRKNPLVATYHDAPSFGGVCYLSLDAFDLFVKIRDRFSFDMVQVRLGLGAGLRLTTTNCRSHYCII